MPEMRMKNPAFIFSIALLGSLLCGVMQMGAQENPRKEGKKVVMNKGSAVLSSDDQQLAQEYFNQGKYKECVNLVDSLKNGFSLFSRQAKEDLLVLKIKALLEEDQIAEAENATKDLLRFSPHYELDLINNNTEDYNRMISSFDVFPRLSLGVRNAVEMPNLQVKKIFPSTLGADNSAPLIIGKYYLMYYAWAEYQLKPNLSLNMDMVYWTLNYSHNLSGPNNLLLFYSESTKFVEIPMYVKRYLLIPVPVFKNILPYVTAGVSWLYMTSSNASITMYNSSPYIYFDKSLNLMSERTQNTFEWICGAGLGYKIKNLRIFLDWRYYGGINSFTNEANRLDNYKLNNFYGYTDNKIVLSKSEIGASISLTFKNAISKRKKGAPNYQINGL
jgi:hypothetical protein